MYSPVWYYTEWFHCHKKLLCPTCLSFFPSNSSLQSLIFKIISLDLPFPEYHIVRIIQYVDFSDWLLSLDNMHSRFYCVVSWLNNSHLFIANNIPLFGCTIICSFIEGHLGHFQFLAIINKAATHLYAGFLDS